ncbi:DUF3558 domain-containing protein [Allokutzneria sp. A3M-2-11 16]|uniref:DUF3558 domain-containing protein n=1 Tax=Allokutzneria sp. A3M-2-11 16 TaxID=2962043 RepID=UPI0020B6E1A9|nr:DUF3558 domain-containing protein [Allokutzneria sp. A3M-2-11 16]MCP3799660.1 DUF3558 domain-containing protein [Allokutzneria sp. A3M-2-11 16]
MAERRRLVWLGATMLALSLAGCVNVVGADVPTTTVSTTPPVQRPRLLDMTKVDPCALFTPEQQRAFGIDLPPTPDDSAVFQSKSCFLANEKGFEAIGFIAIPHSGVDRFSAGKVNADVRDLTVSGFPAKENVVRITIPDYPPTCDVVVDVAPGQVLNVTYKETVRSGPPVRDREYVCRRAKEAAEAAISTLMNKK